MKIDITTVVSTSILVIASLLTGVARAAIVESYEAPHVQNTTTTFIGTPGVETFTIRPATNGFVSNFGGTSAYQGTYDAGTIVSGANQYGGAGGAGQYAVVNAGSYGITLNMPATYFGFWLSAADRGNLVTFYNGAVALGSLDTTQLLAAIDTQPGYFGNPNAPFNGQNATEPYVFVNFYDTDAAGFTRVVFTEDLSRVPSGVSAYESDNHTVGNFAAMSGTQINAIPEPTSLALFGIALVGLAAASRRRVQAARA